MEFSTNFPPAGGSNNNFQWRRFGAATLSSLVVAPTVTPTQSVCCHRSHLRTIPRYVHSGSMRSQFDLCQDKRSEHLNRMWRTSSEKKNHQHSPKAYLEYIKAGLIPPPPSFFSFFFFFSFSFLSHKSPRRRTVRPLSPKKRCGSCAGTWQTLSTVPG